VEIKHRPGQVARRAIFAVCAICGTVNAQTSVPTPPQAGAGTLVDQAAWRLGVRQCQAALQRATPQVLEGADQYDLLADRDPEQPDRFPFFALVGVQYPTSAAAVSVTAVPDDKGACTLMVERITVAPGACANVARRELSGYKSTVLLPRFQVFSRATEAGSSVSLLDADGGCLVIRRFVKYRWRP
jgi:hypothetical protein